MLESLELLLCPNLPSLLNIFLKLLHSTSFSDLANKEEYFISFLLKLFFLGVQRDVKLLSF